MQAAFATRTDVKRRPTRSISSSPQATGLRSGEPGAASGLPFFLRHHLQAKSLVAPSSDPLEFEADRAADRMVHSAGSETPTLFGPMHRNINASAVEQPQTTQSAPDHSRSEVPFSDSLSDSHGQPLDSASRSFFEPRFGQDFGHVRIHTGPQAAGFARSINAVAFTAGEHIGFDSGSYAPHSNEGRRLLAHELTHVLQQGAGHGVDSPLARHHATPSIQKKDNTAQPADQPTTISDSAKDEALWRGRVDQAVRSLFSLRGPGLTGANVQFLDFPQFARQFSGSDLEEKLFTIFLDYDEIPEAGSILRHVNQAILYSFSGLAMDTLREFIKDGIKRGYFEWQSGELDVAATQADPTHAPHKFPPERITPQDLAAKYIAGTTDISGNRSKRSIKMRVAGGTSQVDTLVHEACHFYVSNAFRDMVKARKDGDEFIGGARISEILLEGFAEHFARQVMEANAATFGPVVGAYQSEVEQVWRLVATLGEGSVRAAYFNGDAQPQEVKRLSAAVDEYKNLHPDLLLPRFVVDANLAHASGSGSTGKAP